MVSFLPAWHQELYTWKFHTVLAPIPLSTPFAGSCVEEGQYDS